MLGADTGAACAALKAVRAKVEDYFARTRLAAFDARAIAALNRSEAEYLKIATAEMKLSSDELRGFPLARVEPGRPLPLLECVFLVVGGLVAAAFWIRWDHKRRGHYFWQSAPAAAAAPAKA